MTELVKLLKLLPKSIESTVLKYHAQMYKLENNKLYAFALDLYNERDGKEGLYFTDDFTIDILKKHGYGSYEGPLTVVIIHARKFHLVRIDHIFKETTYVKIWR